MSRGDVGYVLQALRNFPTHVSVQRSCLSTLRNLAVNGSLGGVEVVERCV